jgi:TDG/mug DNA glycosylase family protein
MLLNDTRPSYRIRAFRDIPAAMRCSIAENGGGYRNYRSAGKPEAGRVASVARPSPEDLAAARNRTIPDVLPPPGAPLRVLFCGINPSLYSAATGWHFARPGNRFWPALHLSGFTPRRLDPAEQDLLAGYGLGITNLVARATAQASELGPAELRAGGERLAILIAARRPRVLAVVGVTAYRTAFARPRATIGPQPEPLGAARVWVLPNPSGLNAHTTGPKLAELMREMREATGV